jgi:hypothetical protein
VATPSNSTTTVYEELQQLDKDGAETLRKAIPLRGRAYDWADNWVTVHSRSRD